MHEPVDGRSAELLVGELDATNAVIWPAAVVVRALVTNMCTFRSGETIGEDTGPTPTMRSDLGATRIHDRVSASCAVASDPCGDHGLASGRPHAVRPDASDKPQIGSRLARVARSNERGRARFGQCALVRQDVVVATPGREGQRPDHPGACRVEPIRGPSGVVTRYA